MRPWADLAMTDPAPIGVLWVSAIALMLLSAQLSAIALFKNNLL